MTWQCIELTYRVLSPVHIGYRVTGNIQQTRYYIPGLNFWGATVNYIMPYFQSVAYHRTGEFVRENIRFGYFYPSVFPDKPLYPVFADDGYLFGGNTSADSITKDSFEAGFISSLAGTAIVGKTNTAAEGTLHEVEYITPYHCQQKRPVVFCGHLFLRKKSVFNGKTIGWNEGDICLREVLQEISVGGERRYGFGRLRLHSDKFLDNNVLWRKWKLDLNNNEPLIYVQEGDNFLLAHFPVEEIKAQGEIEPLVSRRWSTDGPGRKITYSGLYWKPGSRVKTNGAFTVGSYGIWRKSTV